MFHDHWSYTSKIIGGVFSAGAHNYGKFHNPCKNKNSDKFTSDAPIDLKASHKKDIDMKNDPCDFLQNLTPWRHKTPDGVIPAPVR